MKLDYLVTNGRVTAKNLKEVNDILTAAAKCGIKAEAANWMGRWMITIAK